MATSVVPAPVLDTRNGDLVVAESIGSLPSELSDRSDSNPAVVFLEASGNQFDRLLFQLNQWPSAVIQKALSLVGTLQNPAAAAIVTQTFTLSSPQQKDTVISIGAQVATSDGSIVFATTSDLTVSAYTTPSGTITLTAGSTAVSCSTTSFVTGSTWVGYQIQVQNGAWYTIASVTDSQHLVLTTTSTSTTTGAFNVGPVTGTVQAKATTTGIATNVGAGALTTLQTSPAFVASTSNAAAAAGGKDAETSSEAVARAPSAFAARDVACSATDYAEFAAQTLGVGGRAKAKENVNGTATASGYVTVGLLSPLWTTSSAVTAAERGSVVRDLQARVFVGSTLIDVPATIQSFTTAGATFACCVVRKSAYDETSTQYAIAGAVNTLLSPNTYDWGRTIFANDLVDTVKDQIQVDRIFYANGVPAVGMNYTTTAGTLAFTNGSTTVTASSGADTATMVNGQTFLIDSVNKAAYLVTAGAASTTLTIHTAFTGATVTASRSWFISQDTALSTWYSLPFSNLAVSGTAAPSIVVVGVA